MLCCCCCGREGWSGNEKALEVEVVELAPQPFMLLDELVVGPVFWGLRAAKLLREEVSGVRERCCWGWRVFMPPMPRRGGGVEVCWGGGVLHEKAGVASEARAD